MTKEKTARLIPNAIQVCTDTEKVRDTQDFVFSVYMSVFIDNVAADRSTKMKCEVYRAVLSAQIQPNTAKLIRQLQMDDEIKHTGSANQEFLKEKQQDILLWPRQSSDLSETEALF